MADTTCLRDHVQVRNAVMPPAIPVRKCRLHIDSLGTIEGWEYANGIRQFCGVPYAKLEKRWTRSKLRTSFDGGFHDGTRLGPRCPHPETEGDDIDELTPVLPLPHFNIPKVDEKNALVMNIALPPANLRGKHPIFVYVHGGSLMYGGAYLAIFDAVKLVSQSIEEDKPLIVINFNYRVGFGGFLASSAIRIELEKDGFLGNGNFGFTDQQVAFAWVQKYGNALGGDIGNVTAVGESAGGISISNQLIANYPPTFHRAVCMSGLAFSIPAWTEDQHQQQFDAVCQWFSLDPQSSDVLERLRVIPEQDLANATSSIQGVLSGTGNPCLDDCFYERDPRQFHHPPDWLKSYMLGDVYHEGIIFRLNTMDTTFDEWRAMLLEYLGDEKLVDDILRLYEIDTNLPREVLQEHFEYMAGDAIFRIPNYLTAKISEQLASNNALYQYHFDQRSRIDNSLKGLAYHAYELLYLFRNREDDMNEEERSLARDFALAWIHFAHGLSPWKSEGDRIWKVWGPDGRQDIVSQEEDEAVRRYARVERMLNMGEAGVTWRKWFNAIDAMVNKRAMMGVLKPNAH